MDELQKQIEQLKIENEKLSSEFFLTKILVIKLLEKIKDLEDEESDDEESDDEIEPESGPVTREKVREWFNDCEFDKDESLNFILDKAEKVFDCEFMPGMSLEAKQIHHWLYEMFEEIQNEDEDEDDEDKDEECNKI
jgi:hypothetical protein